MRHTDEELTAEITTVMRQLIAEQTYPANRKLHRIICAGRNRIDIIRKRLIENREIIIPISILAGRLWPVERRLDVKDDRPLASSHGRDVNPTLEHCKRWYPDAYPVRSCLNISRYRGAMKRLRRPITMNSSKVR